MPALSIVVPVYNVEKYLHRCLDSILAQTFSNYELILVDDGSTDSSPSICDAYAAADPRIKVIHKENMGLSSARNAGLEVSTAPIVSFIDSDDYIAPNLYADVVDFHQTVGADIVEFQYKKVSPDIYTPYITSNKSPNYTIFTGIELIPRIYQNTPDASVTVWNKTYRRSLFDNLKFTVGKTNEDTLITPQLFFQASKVIIIDKVYYYYVQTSNSIMRSEFCLQKLDKIYALQQNRLFYIKKNLHNALAWHDTTYAFVLIKMLDLTRNKYGTTCHEYLEMRAEFVRLFPEFIRNKHFNLRQKLLLSCYLFNLNRESKKGCIAI